MVETSVQKVDEMGRELSPYQIAAWKRVEKVVAALTVEGVNNIKHACEYAGVARSSFYKDMQEPIINQKVIELMRVVDMATILTLTARRFEVLSHQQAIAAGDKGDPRDSTPAARFVEGVIDKLRDHAKEEEPLGQSDAAKMLLRWREKKKVRARRTTVVEEVEIVPDEGEIIDITP